MPCIWAQHNNSQLFLTVAILPATGFIPGAHYSGPSLVANALVDTGATTTGISGKLAAQLQLQPIGKIPIHGVGGIQHHNSYLFKIGFAFAPPPGMTIPGAPPPGPGQQQVQLHVADKTIQGCEFHSGLTAFDVLLGMDIISTGSLIVQGNGSFSFSF